MTYCRISVEVVFAWGEYNTARLFKTLGVVPFLGSPPHLGNTVCLYLECCHIGGDGFPARWELRSPPLHFQARLYMRSRKIKELAKLDGFFVAFVVFFKYTR